MARQCAHPECFVPWLGHEKSPVIGQITEFHDTNEGLLVKFQLNDEGVILFNSFEEMDETVKKRPKRG